MSTDAPQEPDRRSGAPHPRTTSNLFGQATAEWNFIAADAADRLHHAWLLSGPEGVGKATLAWQIAKARLAPAARLDPDGLRTDQDNPAIRPVLALSHPNLLLLRRTPDPKTGRLRTAITVDEARRLSRFFAMSTTEGGARVVIVDAADEMNPQAANAILKALEEPPPDTTFLLVSHAPGRLLPTIRSRCRELRLGPLSADDLAAALVEAGQDPGAEAMRLAELARGSVGAAWQLLAEDGLGLYARLVELLATAPRIDRSGLVRLADHAAARTAPERFELTARLTGNLLGRLARTAAGLPPAAEAAPGEAELLARLAPGPSAAPDWAMLQIDLAHRLRAGRAVNIDPAALMVEMGARIDEVASRHAGH